MRMSRRGRIPAFLAMEAAREARARQLAGRDVIRLDLGQPDWAAPRGAHAALEAAMACDPLGYTDALGAMALREAIAALYQQRYGLALDPACVAVTTGASGAFLLAFLALFDPGDRVVLASPSYPPYRHILSTLGVEAVALTASIADRLQLTPALIEAAAAGGPVHGVLSAAPANPTGAGADLAQLTALAQAARRAGGVLISDEIYHGLHFEAPAPCALAADPDAVIVNSFSKYWGMTGWRVGWLIAPAPLVPVLERLAQSLFICPPAAAQAAALGALQAVEECEARRAIYAANRALLMRELPGIGLPPVVDPDGAFYVLADCSASGVSATRFAQRALSADVAVTPGVDFDPERGEAWVRLSFALPTARLEQALERLHRLRSN